MQLGIATRKKTVYWKLEEQEFHETILFFMIEQIYRLDLERRLAIILVNYSLLNTVFN